MIVVVMIVVVMIVVVIAASVVTIMLVVVIVFIVSVMNMFILRHDGHTVLDRIDDLLYLVTDIGFIGMDLQLQCGKGEPHIAVTLLELCFDFCRTVRAVQPFQYKFVFHVITLSVSLGSLW